MPIAYSDVSKPSSISYGDVSKPENKIQFLFQDGVEYIFQDGVEKKFIERIDGIYASVLKPA